MRHFNPYPVFPSLLRSPAPQVSREQVDTAVRDFLTQGGTIRGLAPPDPNPESEGFRAVPTTFQSELQDALREEE